MLHDIGKVGISDKILLKKSKLYEKELEEVRKHAEYGVNVIVTAKKRFLLNHFLILQFR